MRRVRSLELVGYEKLDYNLYDEKGELVYKSGDELTPSLLMMFNFRKVYRKNAEEPIGFDEHRDNTKRPEKLEFESIISKAATEYLISSTKKILKQTVDNETPDLSLCEAARDAIVEEVGEKLEKIECIGQLRIFDEYTFSHTINVSTMSSALGLTIGLSEAEVKDLTLGALLHDIGKMRIPKDVLNKPGKLDVDEFELMKNHTTLGYQLITKEMDLADRIARVALEHQEKYGGGGYPNGLKGKEISLFAQVTSIIDVYDALVSRRVYKKPILSHDALKMMLSEGSASFNPFMLYKFIYLANFKDTTNLIVTEDDKIT